jgi:hypothetical protein
VSVAADIEDIASSSDVANIAKVLEYGLQITFAAAFEAFKTANIAGEIKPLDDALKIIDVFERRLRSPRMISVPTADHEILNLDEGANIPPLRDFASQPSADIFARLGSARQAFDLSAGNGEGHVRRNWAERRNRFWEAGAGENAVDVNNTLIEIEFLVIERFGEGCFQFSQ